jgi:hypothetical protein
VIRTEKERDLVAQRARQWRDRLRRGAVSLDALDRAQLAHVLDELQHYAVHGPVAAVRAGS